MSSWWNANITFHCLLPATILLPQKLLWMSSTVATNDTNRKDLAAAFGAVILYLGPVRKAFSMELMLASSFDIAAILETDRAKAWVFFWFLSGFWLEFSPKRIDNLFLFSQGSAFLYLLQKIRIYFFYEVP